MGNELGQYDGLPKPRALFADVARQYDPRRFFIDSDGVAPNVLAGIVPNDPVSDRDTLDFYTIQYNEMGADPLGTPWKYHSTRPLKPIISHETGNYVTFSRPDLGEQFQHNIKPFWLTDGETKLQELGFLQEAGQWAEKSERLYALLHKYNQESLRKNPFLSGYHWWLFQDYWTTSNGLVDHYFRPKSIAPSEVMKFNNDVVLLQEGLQQTYRSQERMGLSLSVSNFSPGPLQGTLRWKVEVEGRSVAQDGHSLTTPVPQGEIAEVAKVEVALPESALPVKVRIVVDLAAPGRVFSNDWTAWLYPAKIQPKATSVPIFAEANYTKQFPGWSLQPIPLNGDLPEQAIYLASWPCDPRIIDALKRGAGLVLLDGDGQLMESCPITFRTSWWRAGEKPWDDRNHTGTLVYDHPVTRAMAPDGWCGGGWWHLMEGSSKFDMETAPTRPETIIRALPGMLVVKEYALLFEVGVERGTLLVSGLNHRRAKGRPENEWLVARLLDHIAQSSRPKAQWPASLLTVVSVAPEGCVPGFRRLVANEGEDSTWHSFREDNTRVLVCRQNKPGNRVAWETARVPGELLGDRVTFVFAGGLGYGSDPKTEGFVLEIAGKETLRFDLPEPKIWHSADKRVALRFDCSRTNSVDHFGLFHVTVPRDMVKPDEPLLVGVRSLGTGSQRWFGLNPYF